MKEELKKVFDDTMKRPEKCSREEILKLAKVVGEIPDDLEDALDLLEFDEETQLLSWDDFYQWWSETEDPRDWDDDGGSEDGDAY